MEYYSERKRNELSGIKFGECILHTCCKVKKDNLKRNMCAIPIIAHSGKSKTTETLKDKWLQVRGQGDGVEYVKYRMYFM